MKINNIWNFFKAFGLMILALIAGIFSWWIMICLGIILCGIVAFVCTPLAWIIFGCVTTFVIAAIIVQMFQ